MLLKGLVLWLPVEPRLCLPVRDKPASVFSVLCDPLLSAACFSCPLLLSLCLGWLSCSLRLSHSSAGPNALWPLAFAWLWYQIVGIPDEIPCPACQCRCCDCHPRPHKCPLPKPVLVLTLQLSSEVPFLDPSSLDPSVVAARAGAPGFQRVWAVSAAVTRFSSVVLWRRPGEGLKCEAGWMGKLVLVFTSLVSFLLS